MAAAIVVPLHLDPALQAGVILSVLAPPVGSAAAIAAILGLRPRLALIASLALTLVAPLSIPAFATILGINVSIDMVHLAWRLALIIGFGLPSRSDGATLAQQVQAVLPDQSAAAGVAVIGLVIVGLAMMSGIRAYWAAESGCLQPVHRGSRLE
jgi:hypothetical protein